MPHISRSNWLAFQIEDLLSDYPTRSEIIAVLYSGEIRKFKRLYPELEIKISNSFIGKKYRCIITKKDI